MKAWIFSKIAVTVLLVIFSNNILGKSEKYIVHFGIFGEDNGKYFIEEKTLKIPYVTSESQIFGAIIVPPDNEEYQFYSISYLPKTPRILSGDISMLSTTSNEKGYKSPIYQMNGIGAHPMWLDVGDPEGLYRIEIYVNGFLQDIIEFEVLSPRLNY